MVSDRIAKRIGSQCGLEEIGEILADKLSGSDFHSLLLAAIKRRIADLEPAALSRPNPATRPCDLDGRLINRVEAIAFAAAAEFEAVELSPLVPLGAVNRLTGLDQANVLSTVRAFESASDPTIGMALASVSRRKELASRQEIHKFCCNQRVVRFPLPSNPAYTAHFKLFSLVSAGRDRGSFTFECQALREHISAYLTFMRMLGEQNFAFENMEVEISDTRVIARLCEQGGIDRDEIRSVVRARDPQSSAKLLDKYKVKWPRNPGHSGKLSEELSGCGIPDHLLVQLSLLQEKVLLPLSENFAAVTFSFNLFRLTGLGYYQGPCFHIKAKNSLGQQFMLADGGLVDWSQRLLADRKERMMTSAIGTELLCRMFAAL